MQTASTRRAHAFAAIVVVAAAVLPFAGTLGHGFTFDDAVEVVHNLDVTHFDLRHIFSGTSFSGAGQFAAQYRPLTTLTYAVEAAVHGLAPWEFHLVNVGLHAGVALLVLALALRLGLPLAAATAGACLFAIHPVHVEVVANVAGRKDALATAFVLLAVLAHATASRREGRPWFVLAPLAFGAALLSKENGVTAIGVFAAWDFLLRRDPLAGERRRMAWLYGSYAATLAAYLVARRLVVGSAGVPIAAISVIENPLAHVGLGTRLLTAVALLGRGLELLVFPVTLSPDYSYDALPVISTPLDPRFLAAAALMVASAWASIRGARRWPVLSFAALWYGATILPTSNLLFPIGTIFGDRLLYLPSVALALVAAAFFRRLADEPRPLVRRLAAAGAVAATVLLASRTVAYASVWSDNVTLFSEAVRAEPSSAKAHELLGGALISEGRIPEGVAQLEAAVGTLSPLGARPGDMEIELGVAYERVGRIAEAEALYTALLARSPELPDAEWRLGNVRWLEGRLEEAARLWERTLAAAPGHSGAMVDLGIARAHAGDLAGAEALWVHATQVNPWAAGPWLFLGNLYESRGDLARARQAWRAFLERVEEGAYPLARDQIAGKLKAGTFDRSPP